MSNDHQYKSSLHLSKEASGTDVNNVSVLTIELWQVVICTCGSQCVPFIIYRYIILVTFYMHLICSNNALWLAWFLHTLTCHSVLSVREWELLTPKCVLTIELEPR